MQRLLLLLAPAAAILVAAGCATQAAVSGREPVSVKEPAAQVSSLLSTLINPDVIRFEAQVEIDNPLPTGLSFDRIDYAVDLQGEELFSDSFAGLRRAAGRSRQTVTFPFQVAMSDVIDQSVAVLADGRLRVALRGNVVPTSDSGFAAMPFRGEVSLPLPQVPQVTLSAVEGAPLSAGFRVRLLVRNTGSFALTVGAVDATIDVNQQKYTLQLIEPPADLGPGAAGLITLRMQYAPLGSLGLAQGALQGKRPHFSVSGTIECRSPYGVVVTPVEVEGPD